MAFQTDRIVPENPVKRNGALSPLKRINSPPFLTYKQAVTHTLCHSCPGRPGVTIDLPLFIIRPLPKGEAFLVLYWFSFFSPFCGNIFCGNSKTCKLSQGLSQNFVIIQGSSQNIISNIFHVQQGRCDICKQQL